MHKIDDKDDQEEICDKPTSATNSGIGGWPIYSENPCFPWKQPS
jgi:hypothetical protein